MNNQQGVKRPRSVNVGHELRILIPSRVAGSIIGKRGSNIERLRTENKAIISVPDCPGPERLISIITEDRETTMNVLEQILPFIKYETKKDELVENTEVIELRFLFHQNHAGAIIGKAGANIKELRKTTGANIKIYGVCCPRSTDRVVAVTGSIKVVLNAGKQILVLVNDNQPIKDMTEQYDPYNHDEMHALQYGGFVETKGGYVGGEKRHRPIEGKGGKRYRPMGVGGESGEGGIRMLEGGGESGEGGIRMLEGGGESGEGGIRMLEGGGESGEGGIRMLEGSGPRIGWRGPPIYSGACGRLRAESTTTQVTIPKQYAGAIIGRGGSRIRSIRAESGASITIDEPLPDEDDRIITITGAPGEIGMAIVLLKQNVVFHGDRSQF